MSLIIATPGGSAQFLSGNVLGDGVLAPGLEGANDNFAPTGIEGATLVVAIASVLGVTITGMRAAGANTLRWIKNGGTLTLTLTDQGAGSDAVNRFNCYGANVALSGGQSAGFIYNGLSGRWDLFTVSGNSAAPPAGGLVTFGAEETIVLAVGNNNNLTPVAGITNLNRLLLDATAGAAAVTGIAAGNNGQALLITSINSANEIELPDESVLSLAANQLYGVGPSLIQRGSVLAVYSGTLSKWVVA